MFRSEEGSILSKLNGAEYANTEVTEVKLTMRKFNNVHLEALRMSGKKLQKMYFL